MTPGAVVIDYPAYSRGAASPGRASLSHRDAVHLRTLWPDASDRIRKAAGELFAARVETEETTTTERM